MSELILEIERELQYPYQFFSKKTHKNMLGIFSITIGGFPFFENPYF